MEEWDGITLEDLRGSYTKEVRHRERFTPSPDAVAAGAGVLGVIGAGLTGTAVSGLGVALLLIAAAMWWKGEALADRLDVGPAVDVIEHVQPGLTDQEVEEFSVLHQEYLQMKEEKREEIEKEARNKGGNTGHLNRQ